MDDFAEVSVSQQYVRNGKPIAEAKVDLIKLEYLEHCRLETLWKQREVIHLQDDPREMDQSHHDPPYEEFAKEEWIDTLFSSDNIDSPHWEEDAFVIYN